MGMPIQVLKMLTQEHKVKPITGRFASIGVQTVHATQSQIETLVGDSSLANLERVPRERVTRHASGNISDRDLLTTLFDVEYTSIDRSDYEGASTILDLNNPIPSSFHNQFDFVYSGGSLDNVFDPATLLVNCAKLLKPGGRFLSYDVSQGLIGAYLRITPEWLYSYFAVNEWSDCQVFQLYQEEAGASRFDYETSVYRWEPSFERDPEFDYFSSSRSHPGIHYVAAMAEKGASSTTDKVPTQLQYIDKDAVDWTQMERVYSTSKRRRRNAEKLEKRAIFDSSHYEFIESGF